MGKLEQRFAHLQQLWAFGALLVLLSLGAAFLGVVAVGLPLLIVFWLLGFGQANAEAVCLISAMLWFPIVLGHLGNAALRKPRRTAGRPL